jgi:hypothetical protein
VKDNKRKNFNGKNFKPQGKPKWDKAFSSNSQGKKPQDSENQQNNSYGGAEKDQCKHCFKKGHYKRDCLDFLKSLLKRGDEFITFVDESLYLGATTHVANSLQGLSGTRTLQRGERTIKVANGVQANVEAIRDLSLELNNGFVLRFKEVLYVPSLRRNLISVSKLDDDGIDCHFGNGKCKILVDNKCVGLAFRQDKLYLLSLNENANNVCDENMNDSSSANVTKKRKRIDDVSSKLWHYRLGHISRGRIEWLIKE